MYIVVVCKHIYIYLFLGQFSLYIILPYICTALFLLNLFIVLVFNTTWLKTLEWDILNPDRLINLEINNTRKTSIISRSRRRVDQALISISSTLKFSAMTILNIIISNVFSILQIFISHLKMLWFTTKYIMAKMTVV